MAVAATAFSAAPVTGRFVRLERPAAAGQKQCVTIAEVQVYSGGKNIALEGRPDMTDASKQQRRCPASAAISGDTDTRWREPDNTVAQSGSDENPWWEVDLLGERPLDRLVLWGAQDGQTVLILGEDRKVKWEQTLVKPPKESATLELGEAQTGTRIGKEIPRVISAVPAEEILKYYRKRGTWIESVLATSEAVQFSWGLHPLLLQLLRDFPEDREALGVEFEGCDIYHSRKFPRTLSELAGRYLGPMTAKQRNGFAKTLDQIKTVEDMAPIRAAYRLARERELRVSVLFRFFDPIALERAINAYAAKFPDVYKDREALLKRLVELQPVVDTAKLTDDPDARDDAAKRIDAFNRELYLRHPAIDFKEILFVRRSRGQSGLPANWAGNSSIPLRGYVNDLVRAPLAQGQVPPAVVVSSKDDHTFIGNVALDFNAERLMFASGKGEEEGWRVFETELSKPGVRRQLTPDNRRDIDYYDPCYLPDGRRLFVATSGFQGVPCVGGSDYVGNLHLMEKDGAIRRLTFDQDNSWCPTVLANGRVLYLRWEYTDTAHYFARVLMTMNPDGTDQQEFYGSNSYWPNCIFYTRALPGSTSKFVGIVTGHHGNPRSGELILFDASKGRMETEGVMQRIPGFAQPVENITKDQLVAGRSPLFIHPFPLDDSLFLVSVREDEWWCSHFIALADIYDNVIPLWTSSSDNLFEPIPLKKQPQPLLPKDRLVKGEKECTVYMIGAKIGPGLAGVPAGKVEQLRVYQYDYAPRDFGGHYAIGFEGPWDKRVILGTVAVEEDGSCFFKAPANTPIAVQPLDAEGKALQLMRSWFVGMPGEVITCIGCHEKQNAAVPSVQPAAAKHAPQAIRPWYGPRRNFAFEREVQGVLDAACAGCHNDKAAAKTRLGAPLPDFATTRLATNKTDAVQGKFSISYLNLHPYVRRNGPEGDYHILTPLEFHADTSELIQLLKKGHHGVTLSAEQRDRLITWIDLNVPYWGTWGEAMRQSSPSPKFKPDTLACRQELAKQYANDEFNSEVIANPYQPAAFVPPQKPADPEPAPKLAGWPFDASTAKRVLQKRVPESVYDIGGRQSVRFAWIPSGLFVMGSNDETPAERPASVVKIGRPFWMGTTEITVGQFRQFDPAFEDGVYDMHNKDQVRRGYFMDDPDFPAIRVTWEQANAYCAWLSKKTGKTVRLPTEAQWEWACRAGAATPMNYGDLNADFSKKENLADATLVELAVSGIDPQPMKDPAPLYDYELRDRRFNDGVLHLAKAGSYAPNAWGLHDMHGNVAEWTRSAYKPYPYSDADGRNSAVVDERKVVRGGSWCRRPQRASSSWRWAYPGWMRPFDVGFRVVIEE
jgi:formylglycine-generating enzyme required for sulfatase activity